MTQPFEQWTVLPHGKLEQVDENILTVVGEIHMPLMDLPRRMTVVRLVDGRLGPISAPGSRPTSLPLGAKRPHLCIRSVSLPC